jgi:hypothetical protein
MQDAQLHDDKREGERVESDHRFRDAHRAGLVERDI